MVTEHWYKWRQTLGLTGFLGESRSWCVTCAVTQGPVLVDSEFGLMMYYLCLEMFKFWISILDFPLTPSPSNDVAGPASKCGMIVLVSGYIWGRGEPSGPLSKLTSGGKLRLLRRKDAVSDLGTSTGLVVLQKSPSKLLEGWLNNWQEGIGFLGKSFWMGFSSLFCFPEGLLHEPMSLEIQSKVCSGWKQV